MNSKMRRCPECESAEVYTITTASGSTHGPVLLPELGSFLRFAKFQVVMCASCGLTRFYATEEARHKVADQRKWRKVTDN